jgi:thymidylate synthase (FAD)
MRTERRKRKDEKMILIKPSFKIEYIHSNSLEFIEDAGRTCYKSKARQGGESSQESFKFVEMIMKRGHESVIEHVSMTVRIICDRGVTHELVRHRLCAFSQESTRYCNYKGGVTFVIPPWVDIIPGEYLILEDYPPERLDIPVDLADHASYYWFNTMLSAENTYILLLNHGWTPQEARSVLPNSLKTEIVMTANFREWRHIFKLRASKEAHPQMREIMIPLLEEAKMRVPVIFDNL